MTVPLQQFEPADFVAATTAVNAWRGRCIAAFARAETAATEALARLAERDPSVGLPHQTGQRFALLETTLAAVDDPLAQTACAALARFRPHLQLRTYLCHGDTTITLDRRGRWQSVFTLVSSRARRADRTILVIAQNQAEGIGQALWRDQHRVVASVARATMGAEDPLALRTGVA